MTERNPSLADEEAARLLRTILGVSWVAALLHLLMSWLAGDRTPAFHVVLGLTLLLFPVLWAVASPRNARWVGATFLVLGGLAIVAVGWDDPPLLPFTSSALLVMTVMAGSLAGAWAALIFGAASAVVVTVGAMLAPEGTLGAAVSPSSAGILVFELGLAGCLVALMVKDRRRATEAALEQGRLDAELSAMSQRALQEHSFAAFAPEAVEAVRSALGASTVWLLLRDGDRWRTRSRQGEPLALDEEALDGSLSADEERVVILPSVSSAALGRLFTRAVGLVEERNEPWGVLAVTRAGRDLSVEETRYLSSVGVLLTYHRGRAQAEEAALEREQRLGEILSESPDVILSLDPSGRVLDCSPALAPLLGVEPAEVVGRVLSEEPGLAELMVLLGPDAPHEVELRHRDGHAVAVEANTRRVGGPGERTRLRIILRDVSERRWAEDTRSELEAQLHHAQRLDSLGRLAGGVAHDFNNLLTIILANAAELEELLAASPEERELVEEVEGAAERAALLTRQLLQFSRRDIARPSTLDLVQTVSALSGLLDRMLGERVHLRTRLPEGPCLVHLDRSQLEQVVLNLALNGRDAMPDGGTLTLSVAVADDVAEGGGAGWVCLRVEDDGVGMDEPTRRLAFDPFFSTKPPEKGTGLGLSVVHGIVTAAGGRIDVDSEPGQGTAITVWLPEAEPEVEGATEAQAVETDATSGRVLVIEDQAPVRLAIRRALERRGFTVVEAESYAEAQAHVAASPIDAVLSDVVLPRESGPDIVSRLEALHGPLPVVFMSGYFDEQLQSQLAAREGAVLLHKPFEPPELLAALAAVRGAPLEAVAP